MKRLFLPLAISLLAQASASEVPTIFKGLFEKDVPVRAHMGVVVPPEEIEKYVEKVNKAADQDPEWFREQSAKARAGAPLPYDPKLGLTQEEYDDYLKLWAKREFKPQADVILNLRQSSSKQWTLIGMGGPDGVAQVISTLRYSPEEDVFHSPNGTMKRLDDISADADSILGAWTGFEWRFEETSALAHTKENFAIGKFADGKYGLVIYRLQEASPQGHRLQDKSLVIRFPLGKAGQLTGEGASSTAGKAKAPAKKN